MNEKIHDFRLIEIEIELGILREQLKHIEEGIEQGRERSDLESAPNTPSEDESDWDMRRQQYDYETEVILPRMWRNPFLVSMFSVYETSVTEVASLIQKKQGRQIRLNDRRGEFLDRAKKYYKDILQFNLSTSNERWKWLNKLSDLRNVIAHTNGRLETVSRERKRKMLRYEGANESYDYLVVSRHFLSKTLALVTDELEDLVARYREWDTTNSERNQGEQRAEDTDGPTESR